MVECKRKPRESKEVAMEEEQVVLKQVPSEYAAVVQQKSMKSVRSNPTQS